MLKHDSHKNNITGPSTEPYETANLRRGSRFVDNNTLISVKKDMIKTTAVQYGRVDAKDSIEMGKNNLVINAIKHS